MFRTSTQSYQLAGAQWRSGGDVMACGRTADKGVQSGAENSAKNGEKHGNEQFLLGYPCRFVLNTALDTNDIRPEGVASTA